MKILKAFFLLVLTISCLLCCSKDNNNNNNIDITSYAIAGKINGGRLVILTFEKSGIASLRDVDQVRTFNYSINGETVTIESIGTFRVENNNLKDIDIILDFSEVVLLNIPDENAFLNTRYSGVIGNSIISEPFFTVFSSQEGVFRFGSGEQLATPSKVFVMLNTISGYYQISEISDIFFIYNGQLVYERRVTISGLPPNYFYASGMDKVP